MINWMRQRKIRGIIVVAVVIMIIGAYSILGQPAKPEAKPLKIGVINMVEVFNKSKKREQFTGQLEIERKAEEAKIKHMESQMMELEKQIKVMNPSSELRQEKEMTLKILSMQYENRVKRWNQRINKQVNEQTSLLYNEIRDVIDKYAQENGFTLILKSDPLRLEKESNESAERRINIRGVLYHHNTIDLTEKIIKVLNE